MHLRILDIAIAIALVSPFAGAALSQAAEVIPPPMREFRGLWVATVANIDWPSKPALPVDQQKRELLAILDKAQSLHFNAVILQVRPACDALYDSRLEPWSEYLTGKMGQPPEPCYDPLQFAIEEAHKRGLELHAWFNPYRAHHPSGVSPISAGHISKTHPEMVRSYGKYLWLDPGDPEVQDYTVKVIMDVVKRYDIDGVHIDDYFYPYKEKGPDGKPLDFPDESSWEKYRASGGKLSRDGWRRQNVNTLIERLYRDIKAVKPWVKFGISPFGVYRPGRVPGVHATFDQYKELYADPLKWIEDGWADYFAPQLYWGIGSDQDYGALLKWWVGHNPKGRHLWPGNYTSRVADGSKTSWPASEILNQISLTRHIPGASGNIHFSARALMQDRDGICEKLADGPYRQSALVPASPWLDARAPGRPSINISRDDVTGQITASWNPGDGEKPWLWVLYTMRDGAWTYEILPEDETSAMLTGIDVSDPPQAAAVSAVSRCGVESPRAIAEVPIR